MPIDQFYMKKALELAKKGWGKTNPNPLVGAVIVNNNRQVGLGYHAALGSHHAEVVALREAGELAKGGVLYVNLEPCAHYGLTPPCTEAIIKSGLKKVVVAMEDPNPKVKGKGIKILREAGIEVKIGILEEEAQRLNEIFISYITKKRPFVLLKAAVSLDGKIATSHGDSKWISGSAARQEVHVLRNRFAAIMVGINTVLIDDPSLTTRLEEGQGRNPIKIIVDSKGRLPLTARLVNGVSTGQTILATTSRIPAQRAQAYKEKGICLLEGEGPDGRVDLKQLLETVHGMGIDSILLEGGGSLNYAALKAGLVDKVMLFVAPLIIGGEGAKTCVEGQGFKYLTEAIRLKGLISRPVGEDLLLEAYLDN